MTAARRQSPQPPMHRPTEPAGPVDGTDALGEMQGKIKGGGTLWFAKPVCIGGWRGTPPLAARCRGGAQSAVMPCVRVCLTRCSAMKTTEAPA
jgi:hypothetical protein